MSRIPEEPEFSPGELSEFREAADAIADAVRDAVIRMLMDRAQLCSVRFTSMNMGALITNCKDITNAKAFLAGLHGGMDTKQQTLHREEKKRPDEDDECRLN